MQRRLGISKVVVIDPHTYPNKWQGCVVIGTGRNYLEIDRALTALVQIMSKRYEEIGQGKIIEGKHPRLTILIDEWRAIVQNVKTASAAIKAWLTESRKAAMSVFVASHSDRAKPLGLEGEYDLKDGFAIVRLFVVNEQRQATLDTGNGESSVILPGPFVGRNQEADFVTRNFIDLTPEPTEDEARVLELHEQGESISAIAAAVYGSKGGNQNERVKTVLEQYGVKV